jgi:hypothetical protein
MHLNKNKRNLEVVKLPVFSKNRYRQVFFPCSDRGWKKRSRPFDSIVLHRVLDPASFGLAAVTNEYFYCL